MWRQLSGFEKFEFVCCLIGHSSTTRPVAGMAVAAQNFDSF
jgi:hypothetical protein